MNKLISVIVPAFNQAQYLSQALDSVSEQKYPHWECIIINDGSTDHTETVAQCYIKKDARFIYLKKENGGLSSARNAGLKIAKGQWVQFLDADDYIDAEKFRLSIDIINENPSADIVIADFKMFIDSPTKATPAFCELNQGRFDFENILFGWDVQFNIPIHSGFFKLALFKQNPFSESLKIGEDWVMWLKIFMQPQVQAVYLDSPLAYYRINPNSMTKDRVFLRNSLIETYKLVLQIIPAVYAHPFSEAIFKRLNDTINLYETEVDRLKSKSLYKIEQNAKRFLRLFLPKPSKKG